MHSTETWVAMWKKVFSEMVSPEYAENHVRIDAEYMQSFNKDAIAMEGVEFLQIFWSVNLV